MKKEKTCNNLNNILFAYPPPMIYYAAMALAQENPDVFGTADYYILGGDERHIVYQNADGIKVLQLSDYDNIDAGGDVEQAVINSTITLGTERFLRVSTQSEPGLMIPCKVTEKNN